ncbi:hypothetical protein ACF0H5_004940 [Mactra antiquata]
MKARFPLWMFTWRRLRTSFIIVILCAFTLFVVLNFSISLCRFRVNVKETEFKLLRSTKGPVIIPEVEIIPDLQNSTFNTSSPVAFVDRSLHPNFIYLLENPTLCSSMSELKCLVIVHSAPLNFVKRNAIRSSWTNNSYFPDLGPIKVMFLLGKVTDNPTQSYIDTEFGKYGDILQGSFIDAYKNITYKGIMAYKWLSENCRNVKVILKVDDDIVVNTFKFMNTFLPGFLKSPRHIACRRLSKSKIERNPSAKWYVDSNLFKGESRYPDFCQGFIVVISNDIIPELYEASLAIDFFWIDDVFLYGLVPQKLKSIKYTSFNYGKDVIWGVDEPIKCYQNEKGDCPYYAIMPWKNIPDMITKLWTLIVKRYQTK